MSDFSTIKLIDTCGLACPLPLLKLKQTLHGMQAGEQVRLLASDPNSQRDIQRFCQIAGHSVTLTHSNNQYFEFVVTKLNP